MSPFSSTFFLAAVPAGFTGTAFPGTGLDGGVPDLFLGVVFVGLKDFPGVGWLLPALLASFFCPSLSLSLSLSCGFSCLFAPRSDV